MATTKRAKKYLIYLIAFSISALFHFFGRPSPAWADDAQSAVESTRQAPASLSEAFKKADLTPNPQPVYPMKPAARWNSPDRPTFTNAGTCFPFNCVPFSQAETLQINQYAIKVTQDINAKIASGESLTANDIAVLQALETSVRVNELRDEVKVLTTLIENLQSQLQKSQLDQ